MSDPDAAIPSNPLKNAYFGDVHVHTGWSFDGFTNGSKTTPQDAYDWAKGKPITGSGHGPEIQIQTSLDFYAVSDHAEYMGVFNQMSDPNSKFSQLPIAKRVTSPDPATAMGAFAEVLRDMSMGRSDPQLADPAAARTVWAEIIKTADANYVPGKFTTFAAYEWTSNPQKRNLHRVVVFRDTKTLPEVVFSAFDSEKPEDLWNWMAARQGLDAVCDTPQRQCQRRSDVRAHQVGRQADRRRLQRDARCKRAALRNHSDKGHVGNAPESLTDR